MATKKITLNELRDIVKGLLNERSLPSTPQELIKTSPKELKELIFKQWNAKQSTEWHPEGNMNYNTIRRRYSR